MPNRLDQIRTTEELIREGCAPRTAPAPRANLIADLNRIADGFRWTASRVGQPGSPVRRQAAEDEAAVREAIDLLRTQLGAAA